MAARMTRTTITLTPRLLDRINKAAAALDMPRATFMASVIESYLDESEFSLKAFAKPAVREAFIRAMTTPGVSKQMAEALGTELNEREQQELLEFLRPSSKRGRRK